MRKIPFLLALFSALSLAVCGQTHYFRHYQVENGLSNNTVFTCVQDEDGFMWFGTKDGLNRFDGTTFKIFRNDTEDSLSLGDNFIRSLYLDKSESLYIGTRSGLYKYSFQSEIFTLIFKTDNEVKDLKKDGENNLWFIAGQTLIVFNEHTKATTIYKESDYFSATSVCIDSSGTVWVSTSDGRLININKGKKQMREYDLFARSPGVINRWIEKIYATDGHSILAGTSNHGVKVFDTNSKLYEDLLTYNADKTSIFARDFIQSKPGEYWIATESGIYIYNSKTRQVTNLKKNYSDPFSISDNAVYTLLKDKEGGIWAGTYFGGANYYPVQYTPFKKYFPDYSSTSISGNAVREICADSYGNLWIGTEDAGLNKLDTATGSFTQFLPTGTSAGISYSNIHGLLVKKNELWIGTFEHGLNIMDIRSGKVIRYYPQEYNSRILKSNFIVTLYNTKDGNILIGTRNGLYRFDLTTNSFVNIPEIPAECFVHSIMEDRNGLIWIGTLGKGLYWYDPVKRTSVNRSHELTDKRSLNSHSVTNIFEDSEGRIWVGTEGGGVTQFDAKTNPVKTYQVKNGMPGNTVYKILEGNNKDLWMTTSRGLVQLDPATGKIKVYTVSNGLLSDQFNYNSGYKDANGTMYFGSVKGMISFNPAQFLPNNYLAPLYITNVVVNNQDLKVNMDRPLLAKSIQYTKTLTLNHDQSSFAIDFAALSFTAPEVVRYKYLLEGLDNDWTTIANKRRVYFTDLAPGKYLFRVKTETLAGNWQDGETQMSIEILPPFWASKKAYAVYFFLLAASVIVLFYFYHKRVGEKNKRKIESLEFAKQKEIYQAKIDFFTNVAHEIKTPLTLIKAPLEKLLKKPGENTKDAFHLKIMERNTEKLVALTNQLLDFRTLEMNSLQLSYDLINVNDLITERYVSFLPLADKKGITPEIKLPQENILAEVDPDALQKILNNLLLNAITYSDRRVIIKLLTDPVAENFILEIMNDGQLISPSLGEKIFDPFYRIKDNGHPGNGLGLALSRSLALLHKGTLQLREPVNGMNLFQLIVPVKKTRFA